MKVLIISHNPMTTYDCMGRTLLTLFSEFDRSELCQLYIYPTVPNADKCDSFYRITDKDVIRSFTCFKVKGHEVACDVGQSDLFENGSDEKLYRNPKNKTSVLMMMRDLAWSMAHWCNKDLKGWLEKEKPDAIFIAPGSAKFIYNVALRISDMLSLPIVCYICDDFYFVKTPSGLADKLCLSMLRQKTRSLMMHTSHIITICDELRDDYSREFGVPATTVMTGSSYGIAATPKIAASPGSISYFGSIRCGRYRSICDIGAALDRINSENGTSFELNIYTGEKDPEILGEIEKYRSVKLRGFVSGAEMECAFNASDILLHTEAFDEENIDAVRHSVSTKIADALAGGIPLIAYGPAEIASVSYLQRTDSALCITSPDELYERLREVFVEKKDMTAIVLNALGTARKNHVSQLNSPLVRKIISDAAHNT